MTRRKDRIVFRFAPKHTVKYTHEGKTFVFTDRYAATGKPRPDPKTVCKGRCEGMGCYPDMKPGVSAADTPFVKCERCGGTGKEPT